MVSSMQSHLTGGGGEAVSGRGDTAGGGSELPCTSRSAQWLHSLCAAAGVQVSSVQSHLTGGGGKAVGGSGNSAGCGDDATGGGGELPCTIMPAP